MSFRRVRNPDRRRTERRSAERSSGGGNPARFIVLGLGVWVLWQYLRNCTCGLPIGQLSPSGQSVISAVGASGGADWSSLSPVAPIPEGNIDFPDGSQIPASQFTGGLTAVDANNDYYILSGNQPYAIGTQDANGNWPATPVG